MFDINRALENIGLQLDKTQTAVDKLHKESKDRSNQLSELEAQVNRLVDRLPEDQRKRVLERFKKLDNPQD